MIRRVLIIGAGVLFLLGLELSAESLSTTVGRLSVGFGALAAGEPVVLGTGRFLVGVGFALLAGVLTVLVGWARFAEREVEMTGRGCPHCGGETRRVKRKEHQRVLSFLMGQRITRRRCDECGWAGLSHRY